MLACMHFIIECLHICNSPYTDKIADSELKLYFYDKRLL